MSTAQKADVALFVLSNLPSFLLGILLARSWLAAIGFGSLAKFAILLLLVSLGGGASASLEVQLLSAVTVVTAGALAGLLGFGMQVAYRNKDSVAAVGGGLLAISIYTILFSAYVYSLWSDARNENIGYFLADLLIPPFGIVRGVMLLSGLI